MIILAVHLNELRLKVGADLGKDRPQPLDGVGVEHIAAILRHKDQMDVHLENAVPTVPNIFVISHRPKYH